MKKVLALALLSIAGAAAAAAQTASAPPSSQKAALPELKQGDVDMQKLNQAVTRTRRDLFASGMSGMTPQQLEAFWGVYADFEKEKDSLTSARMNLLKQYTDGFATLSDDDIVKMVAAASDLQKQSTDLRLKYFGILNKKIGAKAAGRFAHIDNYLTTLSLLAILDNMPALEANR